MIPPVRAARSSRANTSCRNTFSEYAKVSLIFGRATDKAITASLLPAATMEGFPGVRPGQG
jgi:hypothetical protein